MRKEDILSKVDHTLLKPTATWMEIKKLCDDAIAANTASVCIPPCFVKEAVNYIESQKSTLPVCTVVGFPNGNATTTCKVNETMEAIEYGAKEIDMVINIGKLKERNYDYVLDEIKKLATICHELRPDHKQIILKVIIETCLLEPEEIEKMCLICANAGADYIKTSTGFSIEGANSQVLSVMANTINTYKLDLKIKAAGGIKDRKTAEEFIKIGADRLGTSKLIDILNKED